ncbi:hypothetical protein WMY93_013185 [Mugilogobius chulae]|uniref:C-type lectin domain-containing protein n=1 Tax=Mugilogobius chulae TaxID=88201 RepID=A0AAW0P5C4_9GOBI
MMIVAALVLAGVFVGQVQGLRRAQELRKPRNMTTENNQVMELLAQVHKKRMKVAELKWTNSPEANLSRALWATDTYCYDKDVNGDLKCHNCPKQWSHYNGMCYKPETDLKTFDEAVKHLHVCSISQKVQGVEGYWVGLRHDGEVWRWLNACFN